VIDDTVTWDNHIDNLISQLNSACHAITAVTEFLSMKALRILHFLCTLCGIILCGNTRNIITIFRIEKIRIMIQGKWILLGN